MCLSCLFAFLLVGYILSDKATAHIFLLIGVFNVSQPVCVCVCCACIVWRVKSPDAVSILNDFFRCVQNVVVSTRSVSTGIVSELYELGLQGSGFSFSQVAFACLDGGVLAPVVLYHFEMSSYTVQIVSTKSKGLTDSQKRRDVFHYLRKKSCSIYLLRDTHFDPKLENCIRAEWG